MMTVCIVIDSMIRKHMSEFLLFFNEDTIIEEIYCIFYEM